MAARIITIAQQKGGAGKTTLAIQLALRWQQAGERVGIIDIDPQGSLARWFEQRRKASGPGNGDLVVSAVTGWRTGNEIERVAREASLILIDSPPHAQTDAKIAIRAAQLVVVPVQPSPFDIWATRPTLDLAAAEGVPALLVLNRMPPRSALNEPARMALGELGTPVAAARIGNRVAFASSAAAGQGVGEAAPGSPAAQEIEALADEILVRMNGAGRG